MESIDVHDLPEGEAQLVAAFVEFLRRRQRQLDQQRAQTQVELMEQPPAESPFSVWLLGVKGTLTREEIYDYL